MSSIVEDVILKKDVYRLRITPIVKRLIEKSEAFQQELDKTQIVEALTNAIQKKFPLPQFLAMSDETLSRKIEKVMAIRALAGLLDDLTPEQKLSFNNAVAGR